MPDETIGRLIMQAALTLASFLFLLAYAFEARHPRSRREDRIALLIFSAGCAIIAITLAR